MRPTVARLLLRLVAAWLLWVGVAALVALGSLPLLGIDVLRGLRALALVLAGSALASGAALAFVFPGLRRASASIDHGREPEAEDFIRLFAASRLVTMATAIGVALSLLGLAVVPGATFSSRPWALFEITVFASLQTAGVRVGIAWRAILGAVTDRISPAAVPVSTSRFLASTFGARAASVAFAVVAVTGAVAAARVPALPPLAPFLVALAAAAIAYVRGLRLGRLVVDDLEDLRAYAALAAAGSAWSEASVVPAAPTAMRTTAAQPVAEAVAELAPRYAAMAQAEERARHSVSQARALKTRFVALMSHDLRSPLNSITGFAEVLGEELDGPLTEGQRESVEAIRESGQELARLVTDILDSARLEAGRLTLEKSWLATATLMGNAIGQARQRLGRAEIALEPRIDAGLPPLWIDAERVAQALGSLLIHVGRMARSGTVYLDARQAQDHVRMDIHAGDLRADDSRLIFDAFRAVKAPSGQRIAGLGLGLALARGLVESNGGTLTYEVRNGGGRFVMLLPTAAPES
ncbi:MAG: hypothetical protein CMN30_08505 [Sandaracinus sp.]|nr:hypothetical protein [Sandaracinus sp.]